MRDLEVQTLRGRKGTAVAWIEVCEKTCVEKTSMKLRLTPGSSDFLCLRWKVVQDLQILDVISQSGKCA